MQLEDQFIAFLDFLEFEDQINSAENGQGRTLPKIRELLKYLEDLESKKSILKLEPMMCPDAEYIRKDLSF